MPPCLYALRRVESTPKENVGGPKTAAEYYDEKPTSYQEAAGGLNRMTIAKFKRTVTNSPFVFRSFELLAIRKLNTMTKIPAVRELFTAAVRAELALRESAEQPAPRLR